MANSETPVASSSAAQPGQNAVLNDEIEIFTAQPLPEYDHGPLRAYAARSRKGVSGFALVCDRALTPRFSAVGSYVSILSSSLPKLIGSGTVFWPLEGRHRYVFVYEGGTHKRLISNVTQSTGLRADVVLAQIIRPMTRLLLDFRDHDFVHGSINPMNMHVSSDGRLEGLTVGDCLSMPFAFAQPALFLTAPIATADPVARGILTHADDLYAFGISIALLLRVGEPAPPLPDRDMIRQKLDIGTYVAITGRDRYTGTILELLRGLLQDDAKSRWTIDDVASWIEGRRLTPKQAPRQLRAARPLVLGENKYLLPAHLALDIPTKPGEIVKTVENNELLQWASRSVGDAYMEERLTYAIANAQEGGQGPGYVDRLISRLAIAVNPGMPVVHRDLRILPEGFGTALACAVANNGDIKSYAELIQSGIIPFWLNTQTDKDVDYGSISGRFEMAAMFLKHQHAGYGLERCVYTMSPETPCLSEKLKKYFVRTPEDLLRAFEDMAARNDRAGGFIDRHIAAFLMAKERKAIEPHLNEINSNVPHRVIMATIHVLNSIQSKSKLPSLPHLTQWICDLIVPIYDRYHDRDLRLKVRERIEKVRGSGSLASLVSALDSAQIMTSDFNGFRNAMVEFYNLSLEEAKLETDLAANDQNYGREAGREIAAILAGVICAFVVIGFLFVFIQQGGVF